MYVVWLDDPSGKYGDHKGFYAYGDDPGEAERNALRSRPGSNIKHPTQSTQQRRDGHSRQPSSEEPDLATLTHQMCALTKGSRDPVCTHTPAEVIQRGVVEIRRLSYKIEQLRDRQDETDRESAVIEQSRHRACVELGERLTHVEALAGEWAQCETVLGSVVAQRIREALEVAW